MTSDNLNFTVQMRGFDRTEVADYIAGMQRTIDHLQKRLNEFETSSSAVDADRDMLRRQVIELQDALGERTRAAQTERQELTARIARLENDVASASEPVDSVEGMSDRIARMMRIASDEARRTKELAQQDAEALTRDLRQQLAAAEQDRSAAGEALAEFQASTNARREKILATAAAEADELLRVAHEERARVAAEIEEAERSRRELYLRLAEEDEENRRRAQEALDDQIKAAWEDDVRNRQDAQRRLERQVQSAWEQAEERIAVLDRESRLKASELVTTAEREAALMTERAQARVDDLTRERAEVVEALTEIRRWITTAVGSDEVAEREPESEPEAD